MHSSEKTEGRTEGWKKNGQEDGLKDRETLTNPDKLPAMTGVPIKHLPTFAKE